MHILMIAPEPFFEPRGTPFSEYHRIRALLELGHTVDLVTYPFGEDVALPGLRVFRAMRPPLVRRVGIGPSFAKVPLDLSLAATALRRALSERYDMVHSHEEARPSASSSPGGSGCHTSTTCTRACRSNWATSSSVSRAVLRWVFERFERVAVARSRVVIVICPELERLVRELRPESEPVLIENAPGAGESGGGLQPRESCALAVRTRYGLQDTAPVILYTGTFEAVSGARAAVRGGAECAARAARRAVRARRRRARADRRVQVTSAKSGHRRPGGLHR
jgi:hypothetical protein